MKVLREDLGGVKVLEPRVFGDDRGYFYESWNQRAFDALVGRPIAFVQDNHSKSVRGVLRGLHYQLAPRSQGKLVRVVAGEVFDVAVDIRRSSPTYGRWIGERLSAENRRMMWVPEGFAHGFVVLSETAEVLYKATDFYAPDHERTLLWNDPALAIAWPLQADPLLSDKDRRGVPLAQAETYD